MASAGVLGQARLPTAVLRPVKKIDWGGVLVMLYAFGIPVLAIIGFTVWDVVMHS